MSKSQNRKYMEQTCETCKVTKLVKFFSYKKRNCKECAPPIQSKPPNTNVKLKKSIVNLIKSKITKDLDSTYLEYLGCNIPFLREWIEYNLTSDMKWNSFGTYWVLDFAFTNQDKYKYCNWSNVVPKKRELNFCCLDNFLEDLIRFKETSSTTKWFSENNVDCFHKI